MSERARTAKENHFGLSDTEAERVRIKVLGVLYTLKAEQEHKEGKVRVRNVTRTHRRAAAMA